MSSNSLLSLPKCDISASFFKSMSCFQSSFNCRASNSVLLLHTPSCIESILNFLGDDMTVKGNAAFLFKHGFLNCLQWGSFVVNVTVKLLSRVIFLFLLFFGMVMYSNKVETKEK